MIDYDSSAKSYLSQNLTIIMSIWKMDQYQFSALIGLNYPTFNNYMSQKSFPRIPTLLLISDVTGIPLDLFLRQTIPIHLIPEFPIQGEKLDMVKESEPIYRANHAPLIDFSTLQRRLEAVEEKLAVLLENCQALPDVK